MTDLDFDAPHRGRSVQIFLTTDEHAQLVAHAKARGVSVRASVLARVLCPSVESLEAEQRLAVELSAARKRGNVRGGRKSKRTNSKSLGNKAKEK